MVYLYHQEIAQRTPRGVNASSIEPAIRSAFGVAV